MGREKRLSNHLPIDDRRTSAVSWVYTLLIAVCFSSLVGDLEAASVTEGTELLNQNQNTYQLRRLQRLRFLFISQQMSESLAEMAVDSSGGRIPAGACSIIGPVASVLDQTRLHTHTRFARCSLARQRYSPPENDDCQLTHFSVARSPVYVPIRGNRTCVE